MPAPYINYVKNYNYHTTTWAAAKLGITPQTLRNWVKSKRVPKPTETGKNGTLYFNQRWVDDIEEMRKAGNLSGKGGPPSKTHLKEGLLTFSQTAKAVGRTTRTLRVWMKNFSIPGPTKVDTNGVRYFNQAWVNEVKGYIQDLKNTDLSQF